MFYCYGLVDPRNNELRYIGKTGNLKKRYKSHLSKRGLISITHKNSWIKNLLLDKLKPEMIIIEEFEFEDDAYEAEIFYISFYKSIGCNLTNHDKGGRGGKKNHKTSKKHIAKMRKLTMKDAMNIRKKYAAGNISTNELAKEYKCSKGIVSNIVNNRSYKTKTSQPIKKPKREIEYPCSKTTVEKANQIRLLYATGKYTMKQLGNSFNIGRKIVSNIVKNKSYKNSKAINAKEIRDQFHIVGDIKLYIDDATKIRELYCSGVNDQIQLSKIYKVPVEIISNIYLNKILINSNYIPVDKKLILNKTNRKLSVEDVSNIRHLYKTTEPNMTRLAERFKVGVATISNIINNKIHKK